MHTECLEAWRMGGMKRKRILRSPQLTPECYVLLNIVSAKNLTDGKNIISVNDATII